MGLVVDDDDVLLVAQVAADAPHHLVRRLGEGARSAPLARMSLVSLPAAYALAQLEGVEVGDDDLGLAELVQQFGGTMSRSR